MTQLTLRLLEDRAPAGGDPIYLSALSRALYVIEGDATVETALGCVHHDRGSAWIGDTTAAILPGAQGVRLLRWELVALTEDDGSLRAAPQCRSVAARAATIELDP